MDEFISYLEDAGCDQDLISEICRLYTGGEKGTVISRLRRHRCMLMDELHESQEKVDRLDFVLRKISKSQS